jgi:predicted PurR-regulated permease PerM
VAWSLACSCAVLLLVGVVFGIAVAFSAAIPKLLQTLPNDERKAQEFYARFRDRVQRVSPVPLDPRYFPESADDSEAVKYIRNALDPKNPQFIVTALLNLASVGGSWLWQSILIMFLLLFLLLEGRMLTRRLVEVFGPSAEAQAKAVEALKDMANQVRTYLVWRTIINFALAIFLGAVYQVMGLSQAWTWALVTAILWYVPYLGPILAGVPPALDAFVTCDSPWAAIGIVVFYTAFVTVEGYFIVPVVMGRSMELNATTVMLACLFWDLVWGTAGLFLAMPLMAAVKAVCAHVPDWQPFANLMGTREEPPVPALGADPYLDETQILPALGDLPALKGREAVTRQSEG